MEKSASSKAPTVVVGVGAGIAAYKVAYVVRGLRKLGWDVHVVPTPTSLEFVGAATWRELSENSVETQVFHHAGEGHVELARNADLMVLAPATADLLARARFGLANDLLTTTLLATSAPIIAFPAMHTNMWLNPATKENVSVLRSRGWTIVDPESGALSSGDSGPGRLPEPEFIVRMVADLVRDQQASGVLEGKRLIITAGGTREALDPVRFLGNRSSGRQGVALAEEAARRGAEVILIAGAVEVPLPEPGPKMTVLRAVSASEMLRVVQDNLHGSDSLIMCAAVGDFAPEQASETKIKKNEDGGALVLNLVQNPDILREISTSALRPSVLVGFGAETGDSAAVRQLGSQKAIRKGADLLTVNRVGNEAGFGDVDSEFFYFDSAGQQVGSARGSKTLLASDLLDRVEELLEKGTQG
ncbi:bifunctional phosphopantothenoylcysteine decarboxylase/phosphopantothenate--cysteine ligase CoaBC [Actinomycetaceae bacterium MB13-C1-2]|nr:bifunctional phosphopantothenoylcysteine decarboxylase/phosphopantothenate--cysteine ligase CoaBC [Actinomycetaceae bacterium MB13-C1-2]